ncbi:MAG: TIM barrel protein [Anaerolineae bacterium]|nr:TIM barrel protein [Anaerolineae bacterium]
MQVTVGTAPDSWGVWFSSDPKQIPWSSFLDQVQQAGYEWIELGPYGYLPSELSALRQELGKRKLHVTGTFVMSHLEDADAWDAIQAEAHRVGELVSAMGGKFMVLIDDTYSDLFTGTPTRPSRLDAKGWKQLVETSNLVGKLARDKYGLQLVYHPHAETHVEYEDQIEALLNDTDPEYVALCLDTGHHAYRYGDPVAFMRKHHKRIPYLHLKSVDATMRRRVKDENIPFALAVAQDMFCEPSEGAVDFIAFRDMLKEINFEGWGIVEQDMYPAPFDKPLPIAARTRRYLRDIGIG